MQTYPPTREVEMLKLEKERLDLACKKILYFIDTTAADAAAAHLQHNTNVLSLYRTRQSSPRPSVFGLKQQTRQAAITYAVERQAC